MKLSNKTHKYLLLLSAGMCFGLPACGDDAAIFASVGSTSDEPAALTSGGPVQTTGTMEPGATEATESSGLAGDGESEGGQYSTTTTTSGPSTTGASSPGTTGDAVSPTDRKETEEERLRLIQSQMTAAEMEDVAFVARSRGWTMAEATLKIGWQPRFAELLEELRTAYPDDYAGAAALSDGSALQAFIAFRADVPESVAQDHRLRGIRVDLRGHRGYSEQQLERRTREVHQALRDAGFLKVVTAHDIESGLIEVQLAPHERFTNHSGTMHLLPDEARAADVRIQLVDDLPVGYDAVYGGASTSTCTAAFAVKSGIVTGMATAGHCGNSQSFQGTLNGETSSTFQSEHEGSWGDFQWHTLSSDVPSHFFYSNGSKTLREAWSVGNAFEGQTLCHFGRTTGYKCNQVRKVNISVVGHHWVVSMKDEVTKPGDSGGPWFFGNALYGVHTGTHWAWFKIRSYFTQAKHIDEALGVTPVLCESRKTCYEWECGHVKVECGRTLNCSECGEPCEGSVCPDGYCCPQSGTCSNGSLCAL